MGSNRNIKLGDMYYIQLQQKNYDDDEYDDYDVQRCTLRKCVADYADRVKIHKDLQRFGCNCITHNVSTSVNFKLWINLIFLLIEVMCPDKFIT